MKRVLLTVICIATATAAYAQQEAQEAKQEAAFCADWTERGVEFFPVPDDQSVDVLREEGFTCREVLAQQPQTTRGLAGLARSDRASPAVSRDRAHQEDERPLPDSHTPGL